MRVNTSQIDRLAQMRSDQISSATQGVPCGRAVRLIFLTPNSATITAMMRRCTAWLPPRRAEAIGGPDEGPDCLSWTADTHRVTSFCDASALPADKAREKVSKPKKKGWKR